MKITRIIKDEYNLNILNIAQITDKYYAFVDNERKKILQFHDIENKLTY